MVVLEAHLVRHGHMVGDRFTVADINIAEIPSFAANDAGLISGYPKITEWLETLQSRPAFQRMWTVRNAEPL